MPETPIPEKKPRPGGLVERLQNVEPELNTDGTASKTESIQERRHRKFGREERLSSITKEKISTCVAKWREVLQWKGLMQGQALASPSFVRLISLLEPPPEIRKQVLEEDMKIYSEGLQIMTQILSEYASQPRIAPYASRHVHIAIYNRENEMMLFPDFDNDHGGFHVPRGGYPIIFWPLRTREDGSFGSHPRVLGHEFGEVMVSKIERDVGKGVRGDGLARHFLKEGLCDVVGYDFDSFQARKSKNAPAYATYDDFMLDCTENRSQPPARIVDEGYYSLEKDNREFAEYFFGGSLVSSLVQKYGFEKVFSYFVAEADASAIEERKIRDEIEAENRRYGTSGIQIMYQAGPDPSHVPQLKELDDLLIELGYTREDFEGMTKVSDPFDTRPEGGIAATIYEVISTMVRTDVKEREVSSAFPERARRTGKTEKGPTFADLAIKSLDTEQAKGVFGPDFSAHDFVMNWRKKILNMKE